MPRLTRDIRADIVSALINHRFDADKRALIERRAALAIDVYNDTFSAAKRKRMDDLPKGWLPELATFKVSFGEQYTQLSFNGNTPYYTPFWSNLHISGIDEVYRRFPSNEKSGTIKRYELGQGYEAKLRHMLAECDALEAAINEATEAAKATLDSFYTTEKLAEAWPEIVTFIPAPAAPKVQLPALPVNDLNKRFNLP